MASYPVFAHVDPRSLWKNDFNVNIVSPENEAKLDASLSRLGAFKPILVRELADGNLEILGGEHRNDSAIRLGWTEVPVFNLGPLDDNRAKEIALADNSRYGADDILLLGEMIKGMDFAEQLPDFLPYTDIDLKAIYASADIALDDFSDVEINPSDEENLPEPPTRPTKTHVIQRFKFSLGDAERVTELIERVKREQGYTLADDMTNAGDALIHLLFGAAPASDD
jgi:hypothetical protein